jgi:hypothetical protein
MVLEQFPRNGLESLTDRKFVTIQIMFGCSEYVDIRTFDFLT